MKATINNLPSNVKNYMTEHLDIKNTIAFNKLTRKNKFSNKNQTRKVIDLAKYFFTKSGYLLTAIEVSSNITPASTNSCFKL